tara:strand:- start:182 stop:559 length:378 start_codon:yes stop_codon:yes gene_type:complete
MSKLTSKEEKDLTYFIKDWLKVHGYAQKDLAPKLDITSSRTSEIIKKIKDIHRKGGMFRVAKKLIEIEQSWINNPDTNISIRNNELDNEKKNLSQKNLGTYSQLDINYKVDIDVLMERMEKDFKE